MLHVIEHTFYIQSHTDNISFPTKNVEITVKIVASDLGPYGMVAEREALQDIVNKMVWKEYTYELLSEYLYEEVDKYLIHRNIFKDGKRPYVDCVVISDEDITATFVPGDI